MQMRLWYYSFVDAMPTSGLREYWPHFCNVFATYLPDQVKYAMDSLQAAEAQLVATTPKAELYSVPSDAALEEAMARIKARPQTREEFKARLSTSIIEDIDDLLWDEAQSKD